MAFGLTSYVDPGTYVRQRIQPGSITVSTDRTLCIVAIAPRTRRTSDEAVIRGKVYDETLTVASSSPHIATLLNVSNRDRNQATLYRNGTALGLGAWGFNAASLTGAAMGAIVDVSFDTGTAQYFTISLDGKSPVVIDLDAAVTAIGGDPAFATATNIVAAINYELGNALGSYYTVYGSDYASVASKSGVSPNEILSLESPITTPSSDIKLLMSPDQSNDASREISGNVWLPMPYPGQAVQAETSIFISDSFYTSSAVYTIDYVSVDVLVDPLANATSTTPLSSIVSVGSFPGGSSYTENYDYEKTSNYVDWDVSAIWSQATVNSLVGPFTGTGTDLKIGVNGLTPITVTLTTGLPNPIAPDVIEDINAAFAASPIYGPTYAFFARIGAQVVLEAPSWAVNFPTSKGAASTITFYEGATSGVTDIFGITSTSLPYEVRGVGNRPYFGTVYYASYDYTRASTDYDLPVQVFNPDQLYDFTSPLTASNYISNKAAIAGEIAFENGVPSLYITLINDSTSEGSPTPTQVNSAIDVCAEKTGITDVVVINTDVDQAVHLMNHVANMSSITEKKYRRGWFGMARDTSIGDPDTPDTFVYWSTNVLQPGPTSSGRGRLLLCAPSKADRILTLEDGSEVTVELDGSYIACADAALSVSLPNASDALLNRSIVGFVTNDGTFETYLDAERRILASNGVNVNSLIASQIKLTDPLTTEAGGAKVIEFAEPSSSSQKDAVTRSVESVVSQNLVGVVPDDLSDFIVDIKDWVAKAIKANISNKTIAPYRNPDGSTRDINLMTDIMAYQDESDPRSFIFKYWYNLKYVAKRFFGEFSVDNPFFTGSV